MKSIKIVLFYFRNFEILNNENDQDYTLHIRASDGIFSAILIVKIKVLSALDSNFAFQRESYRFSAFEIGKH